MSPAKAASAARRGDPVLALDGLTVSLGAEGRRIPVDGVSLELKAGETLCVVGESGCGKSMTALACMGLLPEVARVRAGQIRFQGRDLVGAGAKDWRRLRGEAMAMIFQEPMTSLNPVFRVGRQIAESLQVHRDLGRREALHRATELLEQVGIPDPGERLRAYPDELSGGQRQRVMIAMALACDPTLLIADEPTTALDVTIQAHILELLADLQRSRGMGLLFITHDFGVAEEIADRIAVMYAGQIVEYGPADKVLNAPRHPYTAGLMEAIPGRETGHERLPALAGKVPELGHWPAHCRFADRCPMVRERCRYSAVPLESRGDHVSRCLFPDEVSARIWH
ncbi:ABC transporter ATP-binding protein [Thiohalorhabdus sp. Cl-TMA]|uniref:ABC-type dipeptide transporter n=1 Tax=Thiohalorhabdus methylotrophus TaxID=3242694 RepID=A0ABV4TWE9_9GAMM